MVETAFETRKFSWTRLDRITKQSRIAQATGYSLQHYCCLQRYWYESGRSHRASYDLGMPALLVWHHRLHAQSSRKEHDWRHQLFKRGTFSRRVVDSSILFNMVQTQNRSDIKLFLDNFRPEAAGVAYEFPIVVVADGIDQQTPIDADQIASGSMEEGDLDGELVLGISWPTSFMSWVTGGSPPFTADLNTPTDTNEPYLSWLAYVLAQETLPQVISTSYGDDEQTVPYSYAKRACDGFKQLGARGISVLFSSGDSGVGGNGTCFSNINNSSMFIPAFPASCPWVTAVGGTQGFLPEVAVSRFGSGAGFSNYFKQPAYQTSAVEGYFDKIGDLYAGLYNQSGRGYPDVAAQGNHDVIVWAGNITTIGGTSASSPAFAAVIALVNDALIAAGKPTLGFLNPWIYSGAFAALTDITSGSSIGCDTAGFPAEVGWDAVTGFGTPVSCSTFSHQSSRCVDSYTEIPRACCFGSQETELKRLEGKSPVSDCVYQTFPLVPCKISGHHGEASACQAQRMGPLRGPLRGPDCDREPRC